MSAVGAQELFDWAEYKFNPLFPKGPQNADIQYEGSAYTIRSYSNGNHLGLRSDGQIYGLGPFTNNVLTGYGPLADFVDQVRGDRCFVSPGTCIGPRPWAGAALLESDNDFNVKFGNAGPLSAVDGNGHALVMWEQSDGTPNGSTRKVYSRRYVAGQGWADATTIPGVLVSSSAIVVDGRLLADANGTMTWVDINIGARRFTAAGGWSTTVIAAAGAPAASLADAVIDANGTVHVLRRSSGNVYHATLSANATQWSAWATVGGSTTAATGGADLAVGPTGAVAVWRQRNPGDSNDSVWANRMVGGAWQTPVRIEEVLTDVNADPVVAMDAEGNAIAAWHQGNSLYVNRLSAGSGSWGAAQEVDAGQVSSTFAARVGMVMHADGRALIGWNSATFSLKTMTYSRGAGFSAPVTVAGYSIDRSLRMDADARVVMVHRSDPGFPSASVGIRVYSQELPWNGSWSGAIRVDASVGGPLDDIAFDMNAAGQGVVAWGQNDLANSSVRNSLAANLRR